MHVRFIDPEADDGDPTINLEVPRVPLPGESFVLLGWEWEAVSVTTVYDTPDGKPERYDVRALKRVEVD